MADITIEELNRIVSGVEARTNPCGTSVSPEHRLLHDLAAEVVHWRRAVAPLLALDVRVATTGHPGSEIAQAIIDLQRTIADRQRH